MGSKSSKISVYSNSDQSNDADWHYFENDDLKICKKYVKMGSKSSKISVYSNSDQSNDADWHYFENDDLKICKKYTDPHKVLNELVQKYKNNWGNFSMLYHIVSDIAILDENTNFPILDDIFPYFWKENILHDVLLFYRSTSIEKDMKFAKKYPHTYVLYKFRKLKSQIDQSMYMYNYCFVENNKMTEYSVGLKNYLIFVVSEFIVLIQTFKDYLYENKLINENEYKGVFSHLPIKYIDCVIDVNGIIKSIKSGSYNSSKKYILYS